jgi:hypothetical protein
MTDKRTSKKDLEWGLIYAIPEDAPAGYGARAIQHYDKLDFLPDRMGAFAKDDATQKVWAAVIGRPEVDETIRANYAKLYNEGKLQHDKGGVEVLFEDEAVKVVADTRGSYGYVYLAGWLKPSVDISERIGRDHERFEDYTPEGEKLLRWTPENPPPAIGEVVGNNCDLGDVMVVRYANYCGWLHLVVLPLDPPKWFREKAPLGKRGWETTNIVGGELRERKAA